METKNISITFLNKAIYDGVYEITKIIGTDKFIAKHYKLCGRVESIIINII